MSNQQSNFVFGKKNYTAIIIGFAIVLIGFVMMSGGKSENPEEFYPEEIFSDRRITYAPITVLVGFIIIGVGIMIKPADDDLEAAAQGNEEDKDKTVIDD
jgi:uncharacterized membrane protein